MRYRTGARAIAFLTLLTYGTVAAAPASAAVTPKPSAWTFNGDAARDGGRLLLTSGAPGVAGSAFITKARRTDRSFVATFRFVICCDLPSNPNDGADGFAFVIQNTGRHALGDAGGGLGYAGIVQSFALEFDTWNNGAATNDPSGMHIAFMSEGPGTNTADHNQSRWSVLAEADVPPLNDGLEHVAKVVYKKRPGPNLIQVSIDGGPALGSPVDFETVFAQPDNGRSWMGFTAATGAATQRHLIKSFKLRYDHVRLL